MGIRNALRNAACSVSVTLLITPHGDSERSPRKNIARLFRSSLPLMGIRNSLPPATTRSASSSHYPSWGFGTLAEEEHREVVQVLITPHGDSELTAASDDTVGKLVSLPLMGIRNRHQGPSHATTGSSHYPSWGFGTIRRATRNPAKVSDSLPLMGIRNLTATLMGAGSWTPHYPSWGFGTRKLVRAGIPMSRSSLPLMGIRNLPARLGVSGPPLLITPHGDSEHGLGGAGCDGARGLITPHGDSERRPSARARRGPTPHYPSWGFGTPAVGHSTRTSAFSLPLMGIRNPAFGRDKIRAGGLLITPHGDSEPVEAAKHCRMAHPLITPHGDSERIELRVPAGPGCGPHYPSWGFGTQMTAPPRSALKSSLPLMGIRNRGLASLPSCRWHHSLPLMGIRNDEGGGLPSYPPELITPHGDSELPAHMAIDADLTGSLPLV